MIPSNIRIFLCLQPQDMRCGFERLALAARRVTDVDPRDERALFCFINKRRNRLKVLWRDDSGWCVLYKRLHGALFEVEQTDDGTTHVSIDRVRFGRLLQGVRSRRRKRKA